MGEKIKKFFLERIGTVIFLVIIVKKRNRPRGIAHKYRKNARGSRIQRSCVTDLFRAEESFQLSHYVVGGESLRLVYHEKTVHAFLASRTRSRTRSAVSTGSPENENPAALL